MIKNFENLVIECHNIYEFNIIENLYLNKGFVKIYNPDSKYFGGNSNSDDCACLVLNLNKMTINWNYKFWLLYAVYNKNDIKFIDSKNIIRQIKLNKIM